MFKTLVEGCEPTRGSKYSACVDLYASEDVVIGAGETIVVGLGVCISDDWIQIKFTEHLTENTPIEEKASAVYQYNLFKESHYLQLMLRSSIGKKGLIMPNGVGVIDLDYKDEINAIIHNPQKISMYKNRDNGDMWIKNERSEFKISKGDKIAQITLIEHKSYLFGIDTDADRTGGLGSTGK